MRVVFLPELPLEIGFGVVWAFLLRLNARDLSFCLIRQCCGSLLTFDNGLEGFEFPVELGLLDWMFHLSSYCWCWFTFDAGLLDLIVHWI